MLELVCWVFVKYLIVDGAAAMTMGGEIMIRDAIYVVGVSWTDNSE